MEKKRRVYFFIFTKTNTKNSREQTHLRPRMAPDDVALTRQSRLAATVFVLLHARRAIIVGIFAKWQTRNISLCTLCDPGQKREELGPDPLCGILLPHGGTCSAKLHQRNVSYFIDGGLPLSSH